MYERLFLRSTRAMCVMRICLKPYFEQDENGDASMVQELQVCSDKTIILETFPPIFAPRLVRS
jgi:hypothetical protein